MMLLDEAEFPAEVLLSNLFILIAEGEYPTGVYYKIITNHIRL